MASTIKLTDFPDNLNQISICTWNLSKALHSLAMYGFLVKQFGCCGKDVAVAILDLYNTHDGEDRVGKEFSLQETASLDLLVYLHACAQKGVRVTVDELQFLAQYMTIECQTQPGRLPASTRERLDELGLLRDKTPC